MTTPTMSRTGKGYKGKSQYVMGKGTPSWKGKKPPIPRPYFPGVNAYGMEMMGSFSGLTLEFNSATKRDSICLGGGLLESGATASAGPEASVQRLINAVLAQDSAASITVDQARRLYFRYGSGSWGRALHHVVVSPNVTGKIKSFEVFAFPNPPEYVEKWFQPEMLVPILLGMSHMGPQGAGMIVDFNDGYFVNATDSQTRNEDTYMSTTCKGHYVVDILDYHTEGHTNREESYLELVRTTPCSSCIHLRS